MNWKKPLTKLHLSLVIIVLAISAFFIFVAAPVQYYDSLKIEEAKECAYKNLRESLAGRDSGSDPDLALKISDAAGDKWDDSPPTAEELNNLKTAKPKFDPNKPYQVVEPKGDKFPWNKYPLAGLDTKVCNATVEWDGYSKKWNIYSKKVINDNSPRPKDMIIVGLAFIGIALDLPPENWTSPNRTDITNNREVKDGKSEIYG